MLDLKNRTYSCSSTTNKEKAVRIQLSLVEKRVQHLRVDGPTKPMWPTWAGPPTDHSTRPPHLQRQPNRAHGQQSKPSGPTARARKDRANGEPAGGHIEPFEAHQLIFITPAGAETSAANKPTFRR